MLQHKVPQLPQNFSHYCITLADFIQFLKVFLHYIELKVNNFYFSLLTKVQT